MEFLLTTYDLYKKTPMDFNLHKSFIFGNCAVFQVRCGGIWTLDLIFKEPYFTRNFLFEDYRLFNYINYSIIKIFKIANKNTLFCVDSPSDIQKMLYNMCYIFLFCVLRITKTLKIHYGVFALIFWYFSVNNFLLLLYIYVIASSGSDTNLLTAPIDV